MGYDAFEPFLAQIDQQVLCEPQQRIMGCRENGKKPVMACTLHTRSAQDVTVQYGGFFIKITGWRSTIGRCFGDGAVEFSRSDDSVNVTAGGRAYQHAAV